MGFFQKLFGSHSDRELKKLNPIADKVMALDAAYSKLTDAQLRAKTDEFKARYQGGESLDSLLPEAFATAREACWRVLGMKPYRVQVIGGIVLHQGRIAEMRTGEGKTLVAVLPAYLNALTGQGVHIVTVNDYLAKRDSEWMGKVYRFLGLSVGLIIHEVEPEDRKAAYAADITYGTNNEMGFDYLRDNMALYKQNVVQRGHAFAIVDEVDSILIDEARTPLIISGQGSQSTDLYRLAENFVSMLKLQVFARIDTKEDEDESLDADYVVDEKAKTATLTQRGIKKAEQFFGLENLSDVENSTLYHHINQALRAHGIMKRDIDYVVKDGEVLIVDEFTGRIMPGRRYSDGLHQAIEAKEKVKVQSENKTLATITFQNYFRLYGKLSGMTGTAMTEEEEFASIYKLDIIAIPTNKPVQRKDHEDVLFKNELGKYRAIINQIVECHKKGQPVLVGTVSIEKSELVSHLLKKTSVPHPVLNAKNHEKEAEIIAQAGKFGAVTIATNMAGRGTDIMLGGNAEFLAKQALRKYGYEESVIAEAVGYAETDNEEILAARTMYHEQLDKVKPEIDAEANKVRAVGGLFIVGTERHESRRIDNQLRGRSGRQGDPGASRFYLSLEDDLIRLFGGQRMTRIMDTLNVDENTPIELGTLTRTIANAQKKVEGENYAIRKHVLQFDDVMNEQRKIIYKQRDTVLDETDLKESILSMLDETIDENIDLYMPGSEEENWNIDGLRARMLGWLTDEDDLEGMKSKEEIATYLKAKGRGIYEAREEEFGSDVMRNLERMILLRNVDLLWMDHIDAMEQLQDSIGLRAYAQQDPVVAYKYQGSDMFNEMTAQIREDTVRDMLTVQLKKQTPIKRRAVAKITSTQGSDEAEAGGTKQPIKKAEHPGPNDPCWCGSGKKYKKCHMLQDIEEGKV